MNTGPATPTTDELRDGWDAIAAEFDRFGTPQTLSLGEEALQRASLRPGMRFLDVAAGTGALSIPAARLGADVLATDFAPTMVELLRARAQEDGLTNLETRVMDGQALDLEDDTFDVSGSQNGVSLFPDVGGGMEEMVRVTKPGGRVLIVTFGAMPRAEFIGFFMAAMQAANPSFQGLPTDPPPLPFQLADPEQMHRQFTQAGLSQIKIDTVTWRMQFRSADHLWDTVLGTNPIAGRLTSNVSEEQAGDVRRVLDGMLRERSGGNPGAVLTNEMNIGIGTKQ